MKTKIITLAIFSFLFAGTMNAQDVTTVNAKSSDISDNLDLRAVASIFGESSNLEDFERRLNNPKEQISNLDLNNDGQVDYLRVIETLEGNDHLVVIQSVLSKDVYQDVATLEVEKDSSNNVQVQVVGNTYIYGENYIYEPVYVTRPIIYTTWWGGYYAPYYSPYYWGYYPGYYSPWTPYPAFRYRRNVNVYINTGNHYNYVNYRRNTRLATVYSGRRANGYERLQPNRSFEQRNNNVRNSYELSQTRATANTRNNPRNNSATATPRTNGATGNVRNNGVGTPRSNGNVKTNSSVGTPRTATSTPRNTSVRTETSVTTPRNTTAAPRTDFQTTATPVRTATPRNEPVRVSTPVQQQPIQTRSQPVQQAAPQRSQPMQQQPAPQRSQAVQQQSAPQRSQPAQQSAPRGNDGGQRNGGGGRR